MTHAQEVLVGVDGSAPSELALQWAIAEAKQRDWPLRLVCSYSLPSFTAASLDGGYAALDDRTIRQSAQGILDSALAKVSEHGLRVTAELETGDAAGALGFAFGMVSALLGVRDKGQGCVVDGAIIDVLAMLSPLVQLIRQGGGLEGSEPSVFHDSPFYDRYLCSDGRYITVGAIEPQFYALLLTQLQLTDVDPARQMDKTLWPSLKARIAQRFASQPSTYWNALMEGTDSCFAPVLTMAEAAAHPHNVARGLYSVTEQGDIETARGMRFLPLC